MNFADLKLAMVSPYASFYRFPAAEALETGFLSTVVENKYVTTHPSFRLHAQQHKEGQA